MIELQYLKSSQFDMTDGSSAYFSSATHLITSIGLGFFDSEQEIQLDDFVDPDTAFLP
jgi:hypothetical protein